MFHQELQTRLWNFEATVRPPFSPRASTEEGKPEPPSTSSPSAPREPAPCPAQAPCFPRALAALSLTPNLSPLGSVDASCSVLARLPKLLDLDECVPEQKDPTDVQEAVRNAKLKPWEQHFPQASTSADKSKSKVKRGKRQIETTEQEKVGRALRSRLSASAVDGQVDCNILCR